MVRTGSLVTVALQVYEGDKQLIDTPLTYVHGAKPRLPALRWVLPLRIEEALAGKEVGASVDLQLPDAYGPHLASHTFRVPKSEFASRVQVGEEVEWDQEMVDEERGHRWRPSARVMEVGEQDVVLDGNHPLAGRALRFVVVLRDIQGP